MPPLNIVYIHSHDTGRYIQPYGHAVPTPNLQRLAEQGVLFRQAFCAAPTCSPSRAALLTGQCPHSAGMIGLAHRGFSLSDPSQHLVHTLRQAGYVTALAGVQHEAKRDEMLGYDRLLTHEQSRSAEDAACAFLRNAPGQPFFLSVGFFDTHRLGNLGFTEDGAADVDPRYVCVPPGLPDLPEVRKDVADFIAGAGILDRKMGQVFAAIDQAGLAESTLVICTTDHGIPFPGHKCHLTDAGMGVMLILRGPHGFAGGKVVDAMVSHIDVFPTICELLAIPRPAWLQGKSLLPLLDGRASEINDAVFGEVTYHAAYEPKRAVRTRRYKYIRHFEDRRKPVLPNFDDGPSKTVWLKHGLRERSIDRECLYNLVLDPGEMCNRAADPSMAAVLDDMRHRLHDWMVRTHDPLMEGSVRAPGGALVNDPDGTSPYETPEVVVAATRVGHG